MLKKMVGKALESNKAAIFDEYLKLEFRVE